MCFTGNGIKTRGLHRRGTCGDGDRSPTFTNRTGRCTTPAYTAATNSSAKRHRLHGSRKAATVAVIVLAGSEFLLENELAVGFACIGGEFGVPCVFAFGHERCGGPQGLEVWHEVVVAGFHDVVEVADYIFLCEALQAKPTASSFSSRNSLPARTITATTTPTAGK